MEFVRIFVAAAPKARRYALPALVAGMEVELERTDSEVWFAAVKLPGDKVERLVARRDGTGRTYRGLEFWEAEADG